MVIYHPDSIILDDVEISTITQRIRAGYTAGVAWEVFKFCSNKKPKPHYIKLSGCNNYLDFHKPKIYNETGEEIKPLPKPLFKNYLPISKFAYLMNLDFHNLNERIEVFVAENPTDADSWTSIGVVDVVLPLYINNKEGNPERMLLPSAANEKVYYIDSGLLECPRSSIKEIIDDFNGICIDANESRYYYYCLSTGLCGIITKQTGIMKNGTRVIIRMIEADDDSIAEGYIAEGGCIAISSEESDDHYLCYMSCYCGHLDVAVKGAFGFGHGNGQIEFDCSLDGMINTLYNL